MSTLKVTPGPDAQYAFRLGMAAAAVVGLVGVGALYWAGLLPPALLGFTLVLSFPVYLVFAASVLSVWLGFDKDATDLRPVRREQLDRSHRGD
jgi:choline-glycine betaine transporter